jgi:hypothetical protein
MAVDVGDIKLTLISFLVDGSFTNPFVCTEV